MAKVTGAVRRLPLILVVIIACGAIAAPASAGIAPPADPKALCQDEGWQSLSPDGETPFRNQGECVSFASQSGTPLPAPAIRMFRVLQGDTCTATFFAQNFPAGDYDVTLVNDGGAPQLVNQVTIDGNFVQVLAYSYLHSPGTPASITVENTSFSLAFAFKFSCK